MVEATTADGGEYTFVSHNWEPMLHSLPALKELKIRLLGSEAIMAVNGSFRGGEVEEQRNMLADSEGVDGNVLITSSRIINFLPDPTWFRSNGSVSVMRWVG